MEKGLVKMMAARIFRAVPSFTEPPRPFSNSSAELLVDLPTLKEIQPPPVVEELEAVEKEISGEGEIRSPTDVIREPGEKVKRPLKGPSKLMRHRVPG